MMKQYKVSFFTVDGTETSLIVGAVNAASAIDIVRSMPNFFMIVGYPEEI